MSALTFAQVQVATLQHGDSIRVFYENTAFVSAYNAAVAGDVISLSAGSFQACNINKDSLTIRGVGSSESGQVTSFYNEFICNRNSRFLIMEGIRCVKLEVSGGSSSDPHSMTMNCINMYFSEFSVGSYSSVGGQFVNCVFAKYGVGSTTSSSNPSLINCIVNSKNFSTGHTSFINSVFIYDKGYLLQNSAFTNSIIIATNTIVSNWNNSSYGGGQIPPSTSVDHCVCLTPNCTDNSQLLSGCNNLGSRIAATSIFSNFSLGEMNPERYILTDSAQTALLGSDGTQVGLYGGFMPYTSAPAYPVITRMNVSRQTTADGRLSVDIQVGNVEQSEDDE